MHKSTGYLILSAMSPTNYTLLLLSVMVNTMFVQLLRLTFDADRCHFCRFIEAKLNKK